MPLKSFVSPLKPLVNQVYSGSLLNSKVGNQILFYFCFRLLFYSHWGLYDNSPTTKIEKVYLDGSYRTVLVEEDLAFPNELAIDFKQRRLFWADSTNRRIEYCDFFGRSRKIVISKVAPYGLSVVSIFLSRFGNYEPLSLTESLNFNVHQSYLFEYISLSVSSGQHCQGQLSLSAGDRLYYFVHQLYRYFDKAILF